MVTALMAGTLIMCYADAQITVPKPPDFLVKVSNQWFNIMYNPDADISMSVIMDDSAYAYQTVSTFYGGYKYHTTLEIASTYNEYRILSGVGDIPEYVNASDWNDGERGLIVIKSPDILPDHRKVITYHLARIAERTFINQTLYPPEWFEDGLASYIASDISHDDKALMVNRLENGKWKTTAELEQVYNNTTVYNMKDPEQIAVRAQSALLVGYIGTMYGNQTLAMIVKDYAYCGDLNRSFRNLTGRIPEEYNQELKAHLKAEYSVVPTPTPLPKELVSGHLMTSSGMLLPDRTITFCGNGTNATAVTDKNGFYSAEVNWGRINIIAEGPGRTFNNSSVAINPGEQKNYNITIDTNDQMAGGSLLTSVPALNLPGGDYTGIALIILANIAALTVIALIIRRNMR